MTAKAKEILGTSIYFLVVLIISLLIVKFVGQRTEVIGSSMNDTLYDGDNLILDKVSYRFNEPERYDVIVFPFRDGSKKNYIKRIIGLPGETVQIDADGNIYIDGELLIEDYGKARILDPGLAINPIQLDDSHYFVLGDNRNDSSDSRFGEVKLVSRDEILGRAWLRIWPLNAWGLVEHISDK